MEVTFWGAVETVTGSRFLVEVVRGLGTSDETFRQAMAFVRLLGKIQALLGVPPAPVGDDPRG